MYVKQSRQAELNPIVQGWNNAACPRYIAKESLAYYPNARRYEPGSYNLMGLVGLQASLDLLLEVGIADIASDLLAKREWLVNALQAKGYNVLHHNVPPVNRGGMPAAWSPQWSQQTPST